ncbi:MAG: glycine cleavage T C-terminal barrel domain-containing protein [Acidimicrobiia bacterium]
MAGFEISLSPRIRMSPYFEATVAAGVTAFTVYNHMYMPTSYGDLEAEYWQLLKRVAVWDVAAQRQVEIEGTEATRLVELLSARDISTSPVGQARYAPVCDHEGRLLNDPVFLRVGENRWWMSIADGDMLALCRALASERQLDVRVEEPDVSPLAVQGPWAEGVVASLLGEWVPDLRPFQFRPVDLGRVPLWVGRAGWSKQGGYELYLCDGTKGPELWERVVEAGARFDIAPGAPHQVERTEGGLLSFRTDTEGDTDPFEVGLGRWIDLDRPADFIGKEALIEKRAMGAARRLVGLKIGGERLTPNTRPWPALCRGEEVGRVRVALYSPRLQCNIGLALIRSRTAKPGGVLELRTEDGQTREAVVTEIPFIR